MKRPAMIEWFTNSPPRASRVGGNIFDAMWCSLSTGSRIGAGFVAYSYLHASPAFTTDCRMAYIISLADHCNTLVHYWARRRQLVVSPRNSYMLAFAMDFPEFKESETWQKAATERLAATIKQDTLPDGVRDESHQLPAHVLQPACRNVYDDLILRRGLKTPFRSRVGGDPGEAAEYFMYTAMPNRQPVLGDWRTSRFARLHPGGRKAVQRKDMLYVGRRRNGRKPKELSKLILRGHRHDAKRLGEPEAIRGRALPDAARVHLGAHGHQDLTAIIGLCAYGRQLLADRGRGIYRSKQHALSPQRVSQSDDIRRQGAGWRRQAIPGNWSTTPVADYLSSYVAACKGSD